MRPMPDYADARSEPSVQSGLDDLGPLLSERLLGALELTVPALGLAGTWDLPAHLSAPLRGHFALVSSGQQSDAETAVALLEQLRPGVGELALSLAGQLVGHPLIAPLLAGQAGPRPTTADESAIAAAHGRAYLALSVAVASAVVGAVPMPALPGLDQAGSAAAAIVGVGVGVAVLLLRQTPMPAQYAAAVLERTRAEYLFPVRASTFITVSGHRFALAEGAFPEAADFSGNGLVAVVAGGAVIRTGRADGDVDATLTVLDEEPPAEETGWDEVVEVSWHAAAGQAAMVGPAGHDDASWGGARGVTPPWPGDYRLRVHAAGRDDPDGDERYELTVWRAPAGPEIAFKHTDRLGYRLRGEPEPDGPGPADRPERAYRWIDDTMIGVAATVTVITGSSVDAVLRAFGADPARPESLQAIDEEAMETMAPVPSVAVLDAGPHIVAVEYNGWQGSDETVLCLASAGGRAASMYWGAHGVTRRSFAENGRLLASYEWLGGLDDSDTEPAIVATVHEVDSAYEVDSADPRLTGLVAVERFTGYQMTPADLERIEAADVAYRIDEDSDDQDLTDDQDPADDQDPSE